MLISDPCHSKIHFDGGLRCQISHCCNVVYAFRLLSPIAERTKSVCSSQMNGDD